MIDLIILTDIFLLGYALLITIICVGMIRLHRLRKKRILPAELPTVSVVVSCKNEERDLPQCIEALIKLDYPLGKLEIILVDDDSSDNTASIMNEYAEKHPHISCYSTKGYQTKLRAKARGIAKGIEQTTGDWIFITDADAIVPDTWLKEMLRGVDEKTGIIGAMLTVEDMNFVGILEKMTWGYTLPYAFGAAGLGSSFICVGPNMAFKKSLYMAYGGLEKVDFTIAEDLAIFTLIQEMKGKSLSHINQETTLSMKPVPSFRHLLSQHRRWLKGPLERGASYSIGVSVAFAFSFVFSLLLFLAFFKSVTLGLGMLGIKILIDMVMYGTEKVLTGQSLFLRYAFLGSLYVTITMLWLPLSLLVKSAITWEGDGYVIKYEK